MRGKLLFGYIEDPRLEGFINGFIACERHANGWFDRPVEYMASDNYVPFIKRIGCENRDGESAILRTLDDGVRTRTCMRGMAVLLVAILLCAPVASACETEAANALLGKFPSPTGISPDKDESIRETVRLASIGHETARYMLWRVLMGETFTELEIAQEIDRSMEDNGSNPEWKSFDTIVASGENGAIPHGDPENNGAGPKIVEIGDVVVVDLGARVNDWVSDVTRSYIVGPTTNETIIEVYMAVYDAQNLTFPVIEAGTPAWVPDDIARTHIEDQVSAMVSEYVSTNHPCFPVVLTTLCSDFPTTNNLLPFGMQSLLSQGFILMVGLVFESKTIS